MGCVGTSQPKPSPSPQATPALPPLPPDHQSDPSLNNSGRPQWDYSHTKPTQPPHHNPTLEHHPQIKQSNVNIEVSFSNSNPGQVPIERRGIGGGGERASLGDQLPKIGEKLESSSPSRNYKRGKEAVEAVEEQPQIFLQEQAMEEVSRFMLNLKRVQIDPAFA